LQTKVCTRDEATQGNGQTHGELMKSVGCLLLKLIMGALLVLMAAPGWSQVSTTTVQGTVYRADGTPATGTMLVSWPAFTTASNLAVAAGTISVDIGVDGFVTLNLAPNLGAYPAGSYYTAVYHLSDGTVSKEYWTVPAASTATIAGVRAQLQPAMVAMQSVSKSYVDALIASVAPTSGSYLPLSGGTLAGPLQLAGDPVSNLQASSKHYVDQAIATAVPLSGGVVTGTLAVANQITKLPRSDVRSTDFAGGADPTGTRDSSAAINAAVAFALANAASSGDTTYPTVYLPPGHYKVNGTIRIPSSLHMVGDSNANTILQETGATASLITVYGGPTCSIYTCFGGLENITLEGSGKATTGTLLEMNVGQFVLRDMHFYNSAGRGLQMNGPSERMVSYDSTFNDIRWPLVMAGDTNEDYFYNTQIVEAGQTKDPSGSPTYNSNWCYSVNCTNGVFNGPGTTANPTILYPDPHGSIHLDKAVNVSFIGGSIKSTDVLSGVRVWNGDIIKFENLYHEDVYGGNIPRTNRAYIIAGKGEQTYLTGTLSGAGLIVPVKDPSWMPQYFGFPSDVLPTASADYYAYVLLPQDYNRASTAASAYVPGLQQNQYEIVNVGGFASDGNLYIQTTGRNQAGSTAPAGTQWPAGTVIEQYGNGATGTIEFNNIHLNQIQGPTAVGGYQVGCNQTNVNACGEIVAGYAPDIQNPTSNPATNQVGFYAPLGDPNDPVPTASVTLSLRSMDMGNNSSNPYVGQIATHHRVFMQIYGGLSSEGIESTLAVNANASGKQISIQPSTGGSYVTAPVYPSTGVVAAVQVSLPNAGTLWDSARGIFTKKTSVYGNYQQYGGYMSGMQYQNLYCLFDTPAVDGGPVMNRFCTGGGPSNTATSSVGYGGGIEYDSWSGTNWINLFKVYGLNGAGTMSTGAAATFGSTVNVSGATNVSGALVAGSTANVAGTLTAAGAAKVGGSLTASIVNNTITVDGLTYTTLGAAWNAAVAAATSTGHNQTIWLGPGTYAIASTMSEPGNGACVNVIGSAGTTMGANVASVATILSVTSNLNGDVFFLGNTTLTEGCTFRDLTILAGKNATHGFEFQWCRGLLIDSVNVNDTVGEGILIGEESNVGVHQAGSLLRNVTVSYSTSGFTPASRPMSGIHLQKTAMDSYMNTIIVRNGQTAAVYNEGTGNIGYGVHGFGYPYTCTTAPCSNTASSGSAANASYASSYVIYDTGGAGSVWTDTYADSPSIAAFYVGANGIEIHGGHVQWPELNSFPNANLASVSASVTNNMMIADVDCLGMSSSVNWINYGSSGGVPPTFASVHHLTGCGNYYQALEPATTTGFSGGGASNNAPSSGQVATVWVAPKAASGANYSAYSAQLYSGYTTDIFEGHIAAANPFFNITYQGTIRSQGGIMLSTVLNTASTLALTTANKNVIANAASGAQTLTLPSCFTLMADKQAPTGMELTVVKSDTSANTVTLQTVSSQTINYQGSAATTLVISSAGKRTLLCGPDNNWYAF
jgi:hypothetical protein